MKINFLLPVSLGSVTSVIYSHFACVLEPQEQKSPLPLVIALHSVLA